MILRMSDPESDPKPDPEALLRNLEKKTEKQRDLGERKTARQTDLRIVTLVIIFVGALLALGVLYFMLTEMEQSLSKPPAHKVHTQKVR